MSQRLCLVADVGGTNTRVALARGTNVITDTIKRIRNSDFDTLEDVLRSYLTDQKQPDAACVAIAGPVRDGLGLMTNLDWKIDTQALQACTGAAQAAVLNDLQAQGYALDLLPADKCVPVLPGQPAPTDAARLVVGIGTGFNLAAVYRVGERLHVSAAEAGHIALPVTSADDLELVKHLSGGIRAEVEDALSGPGLRALYGWVIRSQTAADSHDILAAAQKDDPDALRSRTLFLQLLGAVVGDLALCYLPFGGVYFVGGMSRALCDQLQTPVFTDSFAAKGRFSDIMADFPISVITDDYAALQGCAAHLANVSRA